MLTLIKLILDSLQNPVRFRALMLILLLVLALGVDRMITTIKDQDPNKHHENILSNTYAVSRIINDSCESSQKNVNASRCYVFEFHNGTRNIAGVPWVKASNTYETVAPGVSAEIKNLQSVSIREVTSWLPSFINNECIHQVVAKADPVMYELLNAQGIDELYVCPIFFSFKKEPIGFVGFDFNKGWKPSLPPEQIEKILRELSMQVSKQLLRVKEDL